MFERPNTPEKKEDPGIARIKFLFEKQFKKVEVVGKENIGEIPQGKKIIVVTTHLSHRDLPLAIGMLGNEFPSVGWGEASTHERFSENPGGYIGRKMVGEEHSFSVTTNRNNGQEQGAFDPEDFEPMKEAMNEGKTIFMAAYYRGTEDVQLPDHGGYGAVLLAQAPDTIFLPVAIDIKEEENLERSSAIIRSLAHRPEARVSIGKPFDLEKIPEGERINELMKLRKERKLSTEEVKEFSVLSKELRARSDEIMGHLAPLLPEERRGVWAERTEQSSEG
jgi:hypothetical protein